jgi:hypothetical protein
MARISASVSSFSLLVVVATMSHSSHESNVGHLTLPGPAFRRFLDLQPAGAFCRKPHGTRASVL